MKTIALRAHVRHTSARAWACGWKWNGQVMQSGSTADLLFDPVALVEYVSTIVRLRPGDIIATGTPAGIGHTRDPQRFLAARAAVPAGTVRAALDPLRGRQDPRPGPAPDHGYYAQVNDRYGGKRAALSQARKILRQACHILAGLGDDALARLRPPHRHGDQPVTTPALPGRLRVPRPSHWARCSRAKERATGAKAEPLGYQLGFQDLD
jgi:hypothetical protein